MPTKDGWQLNEDGPDIYEQYIVPAFSGAWAEDMVARADLQQDCTVDINSTLI